MLTVDQMQDQGNFNPGGPQFGQTDQGGWKKGFRGWINKYGSSVILPIIALLVLAGGIYLYARQKTENTTFLPLDEQSQEISIKNEAEITETTEEEGIQIAEEIITPSEEEIIQEIIPQENSQSGSMVEKAEKGEGITHLARKAVKNYLTNNSQNLSNEHKVYIEDYIKDKIGSRPLEVGEEISFSQDLIQEAVNASKNLTPEQLKVIEQYSALVTW